MARIRTPKRVILDESAYVPPAPIPVPVYLADLVESSWVCYSAAPVAFCGSPGPGVVCTGCAMVELGEEWTNFKARTNAGITRAAYERRLAAEQRDPDPVFRRAQAWARLRKA